MSRSGLKQRILAMLLVLVMVISMLPVGVFAEEVSTPALTRLAYYDSGVQVIDLTAANPSTTLSTTSEYIGLAAYFDAELYTATAQFTGGEATSLTAATSDYSATSVKIPGTGTQTLTITVSSKETNEVVETHTITVNNPEPTYDEDNTIKSIVVEDNNGNYAKATVYQADASGNATDNTTINNDHKYYVAVLPAGTTGYYLSVATNATSSQKQNAFDGGEWESVTNYPVRSIPASGTSVVRIRLADDKIYAERGWNGNESDYNYFTLWVKVEQPAITTPVEGVALNKDTLVLTVGAEETLIATVSPENATNQTVIWTSDNTAVASVENGVVKAVTAGTANITVITGDGSKTATCVVTVEAEKPVVTSYTVSTAQELIDAVSAANEVTDNTQITITLASGFTLPSNWIPVTLGNSGANTTIVFDGNGKTVTLSGTALFNGVYNPCVVKNLTVTGTATGNSGYNFGPIAISLSGTMQNCVSYATVTNSYSYSNAGGVVGALYSPAVVKDCAYLGSSVSGAYGQGAIAAGGQSTSCSIDNCWWTVDVDNADGNGSYGATVTDSGKAADAEEALARIAGTYDEGSGDEDVTEISVATDAELTEAIAKANATTGMTIKLTASFESAGNLTFNTGVNATLDGQGYTITLTGNPLFSSLYSGSTVKNLMVKGSVSSSAYSHVGAIAGSLSGTITNCLSYASVTHTGYYNAGGLAGSVYSPGSITNSAALGPMPTGSSYGTNAAICAYGYSGMPITNCYWTADTTAADGAGSATLTDSEKKDSEAAAITAVNTALGSSFWAVPASAADDAKVYVTIADGSGKLVLVQEPITVTDKNSDGKLTIDEALYAAHEAKYTGGAAAGYASAESQYGLSLTKLWGTENGGSYGYYVNNASAWSLEDGVKEGDYLNAFVYTDLTSWSDTYCYFSVNTVSAEACDEIELTLSYLAWNNSTYAYDVTPVNNAVITLDGAATEYKTDANGKVKLTISAAGTYTISATSTEQTLVPPVCVATITADEGGGNPSGEVPKLTGFEVANNLSFTDPTAFSAEVYAYALTHNYLGSNSYGKITATFDAEKYTAEFVYNGGSATALASESSAWVMDIPYGTSTLTVTVKEINGTKTTDYTFTITRPRATVDTLDENYGGIYISTPSVKLQQADSDGTPIADTEGKVLNTHAYYYARIPKGNSSFVLTLELSATTVHSRYSVNNGTTWTENSLGYSVNTNEIPISSGGTVKVLVQILSDDAYYQGTEGFAGKTAKEFTIWVEAEADSGAQITFSGSGTQADPYILSSAADFDLLDDLVEDGETFSGKYFKVTEDVTMTAGWDGIGAATMVYGKPGYASYDVWYATSMNPFAGILDGNGHTLTFPNGSQPLFDCVRSATIKNIKIKGNIADDGLIANYVLDGSSTTATISGVTILSGSKIAGSGLLGGYASGANWVTITDCHVESGVTIGSADASNIGGIAGDFNGTISGSTCAATIYGKDFVGGIVAGQGQSTIDTQVTDCTFSGSIIASGNYVGGIAGAGYTGSGFGIGSAPNAHCIDIKNCTVTGSITGSDYVGGILGAEPGVMQCWDNGVGEITGNQFTGTISSSGKYVGGVIGYMKSINRYNLISNNTYKSSSVVTKGIGGASYVDTSCANPTALDGVTYVNSTGTKNVASGMSKADHNRTDDPLGADADNLAREIEAPKPVVSKLEISGNYKTEYIQGEKLDLSKATFAATWSDGSTTGPALADITVQGYDAEKLGSQKILLTYGAASCEITVTVKSAVTTITVYFTMLGDTAHGDNGSKHTLVDGNLTTWIGKTAYTVDANSTVLDVFKKVAQANGITYVYSNNYISSVTRNGVTLTDETNGSLCGWMYTLNGAYSDYGVSEQHLKDGDVIIFHYTDDYNREYNGGDNDDDTAVQEVIEKINTIGTVSYTNACKQKIDAARKAYDALPFADKKKVTNLATLEAAEKAYADLKKADDQKKADAVDVLINKIDTVITLDSEPEITAARSAYDKLTADQKALVKNYKKLTNAETKLAELKADDEDKKKAQEVIDMIDKLGKITAESEDAVKAARAAYDKLTDIQKALVTNYAKLEAAEAELERLAQQSKYEDAYKTTGDYLGKQDLIIGSEWAVIGLIRSGHKVDDSFYKTLTDYIAQTIDENNRLHNTKSTDNARMILVLTAMGTDATNVEGYNLVAGLNSMEYIQKQGINGPIFALIALDSGNYAACGDVTREALIQTILDAQLADGGWALSGEDADADMTGMALQALAPYYGSNSKVKAAVDKGVDCLSKMQNSDGGFSSGGSATAESVSQVIVALTALGINPDTDERFVKNGKSAVDALLTYYVTGGGFKHIQTGDRNGLATEQGYYALAAYARFLNGETALYDMTDVLDKGGDTTEPTQPDVTEPTETVPSVTEPTAADDDKGGFFWWIVIVVVALGAGVTVAAVVFSRKKVRR